ncbi:hypothetical protein KDA_47830 [Dictyobacter alpinus]|uniref:Phenolphthiocerol/phthiocerol polyketide synthase subunit E n=1 Tax=Dictyobacter alpinus TaxID=2014873 RepID=A0A402BD75_9CHLR|nr:type I polyketide synthase [Dictyobacter alpinus]GCE29299.1 hypothetical protein KDA_47830 [Dictyobacter alpinus]
MTDNDTILQDTAYDTALAIVGMSGRFPGANDLERFWQNLADGVMSIQSFSEQELLDAGLSPELIQDPQYVKAGTTIKGITDFDASFFGFTPREAQCLDPQHRLFLECSWEALEQAGYPPDGYDGLIGVFAGSHTSDYREQNLTLYPNLQDIVGNLQISISNDCDALASMVSYKLNLKGPGVAVQTFCSTSLVATHMACQSLLTYDCDIALAGGAVLKLPQPSGYLYEEGGIFSPDGQCRTFDGQSQGSVIGNGVGVVAIKRLKEAIEDGDHIYAIIRGSATNNDGSVRVGYTAPGLNGQSAVIADAITHSGVPFESISYIEAHGTGTKLGDAIELAALLKSFRPHTTQRQFCALGSVKPNIGHLDRASGVTGLIKTALALQHKQLPPSLNFEQTSSDIQLEESPFFVNTRLQPWLPGEAGVRRAGVNSFGLGGTNAHVVLEEAPLRQTGQHGRAWQLLPLAARSQKALAQMAANLATYLTEHQNADLRDVAYTLQVGRTPFLSRQALVCRNTEEAITLLQAASLQEGAVQQNNTRRPVALLFPDNPEAASIGWELVSQEAHFKAALAPSAGFIRRHLQCAMSELFNDAQQLERTYCGYVLWSYGMTQVLQNWGVEFSAVLGEGIGAIVAMVVAGILSLEDGLRLARAQAQDATQHTLASLLKDCQRHGALIPYVSTLTSDWLTEQDIQDADILACQVCTYIQELPHLLQASEMVLLEVGDGSRWTQHQTETLHTVAFVSTTHAQAGQEALLHILGRLWERGVPIDWKAFSAQEQRLRMPLPTYPFERQRIWVDHEFVRKILATTAPTSSDSYAIGKEDRDHWFYRPTWQAIELTSLADPAVDQTYLIFLDTQAIGEHLAQRLESRGARVIRVYPEAASTSFSEEKDGLIFHLDRTRSSAYQQLFTRLAELETLPAHILHCALLTLPDQVAAGEAGFQTMQELGLYSLLFLLQAYEKQTVGAPLKVTLLTNQLQQVKPDDALCPEKSPVLGLCKVASQENPDVLCRSIDLETGIEPGYEQLLTEILSDDRQRTIAYRQGQRWIETYAALTLAVPDALPFRPQGTYLITGGLGGVGLLLATYLAQQVQAQLALVSRSPFPERTLWSDWLLTHEQDDRTSQQIRQLQAIEALGSKVMVLQADVADKQRMREVVEQVVTTYAGLHGVIHAAGISDSQAFGSVQDLGQEAYAWHFGPKVHGLYALTEAIQDYQPDFCILFSSLSTILGGLGLSAYTAANRFMDTFAAAYNRQASSPWLCVNWDSWQVKENPHGDLGKTIAAFTMTLEEGTDAFTRALISGETHLVNSTGDLQARVKQWIYLESLAGTHTEQPQEIARTAPAPADYEQILEEIWRQTLGLEQVGLTDNFFDLGGNSLTALQLVSRIRKTLQVQLPAVALFEAPSISAMARYLQPAHKEPQEQEILAQRRSQARQRSQRVDIAIIGMSGRFPGASTVEQYWQNLRNGVESLTFFSEEELLEAGIELELINNPAYVRARPILKIEEVETFDAAFFGYSPREAELTDPQHRLFLECCWEALEHAGYDAERYPGMIALFGGTNISSYILKITEHPEQLEGVEDYQIVIGNDKDSLATSVSYKMNLRGPSLTVQTFCSTSLVATHLACQNLINGECDLAMAGGVSLRIPSQSGYLYQLGGQESVDGHCYTFDARATGSTFGDGAGVVVLKRLEDALADGDTIHAVIKGSAMNNDGSLKVSYTAPSVNGQAEVVMQALAHANLSPEQISYVEAHGTATEMGDPIEVASLTKAFRSQTPNTHFCALGSVKPNVGHMDRAAGVSGLIKVVESLKHNELPPSLNFEVPNPEIDFASSPFYVNTSLTAWPRGEVPRRAGVNSLGMGGTNVHMIVEEAPVTPPSGPSRPYQLLLLSARTPQALEATRQRLHEQLMIQPELPLPDIAYTLQVGRKQMEQRTMLVCQDREDALRQLSIALPAHHEKRSDRPVALLFSGVGEQYPGMAGDLYQQEPIFRACVERCCTIIQQRFQIELLPLFVNADPIPETTPKLNLRAMVGRESSGTRANRVSDPIQAQCGTFILEYALTQLLSSWGVQPQAVLGYSLGEYIAATVAGVFELEDALSLVVQRAQLVATLAPGAMLAVFAAATQVESFLVPDEGVSIAIFTGPNMCVLSGSRPALERVSLRVNEAGIVNRFVESEHAFHSSHMIPIREQLTRLLAAIPRHVPALPYLSNVTGDWITAEQIQDAGYWARHLCEPVRFSACVSQLLLDPRWLLLEVGIGQMLSGAVKQHADHERAGNVISTLPSIYEHRSAQEALLRSLGQLWIQGAQLDWSRISSHEQRRRVPLPTYPFERQRYWLDVRGKRRTTAMTAEQEVTNELPKIEELADWFFLPTWTQMPWPKAEAGSKSWLLFMDTCGVGEQLLEQLQNLGERVITVYASDHYARLDITSFCLRPTERHDYQTLLSTLSKQGIMPERCVHLWSVTSEDQHADEPTDLTYGMSALLALAQALGNMGTTHFQLEVISNNVQDVTGSENLQPEKSLLIGPGKVIQQEYTHITCRHIDIVVSDFVTQSSDALCKELHASLVDTSVALRGKRRWVQTYKPFRLEKQPPAEIPFRSKGVYLILGGLGGIGLGLATHLAQTVQARLVLVGRTALPPRSEWEEVLHQQGEESSTGRRIQQVQQIEALGAQVLLATADVAHETQMQAVIEQTLARFGVLHGIFQAAAVPPSGLMQLKTPEQVAEVLAPKVQGTLILHRLLKDYPLDFLVLFSSMSSSTGGGPGQVDYCSANAFLDAFAHKHSEEHGMTIAIDWGEWQWDAWSAGLEGFPPEVQRYFIEKRRDYGISFEEGMDALTRIMLRRLTHVVVATQDFARMVEGSKTFSIDTILGAVAELRKIHTTTYPRPLLSTPYVAPESEFEQHIAQVWSELLGIEQIGLHDNFFEMGGHSLLGSQLIVRLRQIFQLNLSLELIFESATVAELAIAIELALIDEIEQPANA